MDGNESKNSFLNSIFLMYFPTKIDKFEALWNQIESFSFRFVTIIGQNGRASGKKLDPPRSVYVKIEYSTKNITFDRR